MSAVSVFVMDRTTTGARPPNMTRPTLTPIVPRLGMMDDCMVVMALMIKGIEEEVELTRRWIGKYRLDPRVMQAMAEVPRHEFIPAEYRASAYYDGPVPIGHGQTISQPYIVALMTDLLEPEPGDVVLEIGTGCGYQAAILSRLVAEVYSVEIVSELAAEAAARLRRLGYD